MQLSPPKPESFYICPKCGNILIYRPQIDNYDECSYSDGKYSDNPQSQFDLTKCPKCDTILWLSDLGEIAKSHHWIHKKDSIWQNPNWFDWVPSPDFQDLLRALTLANDKEKEIYIRQRIWWKFNDTVRYNEEMFSDGSDPGIWEQNCHALLSLLNPKNKNHCALIAELYRNLGQFEESMKLLDTLSDRINLTYTLMEECTAQNTKVVQIKIKSDFYKTDEDFLDIDSSGLLFPPLTHFQKPDKSKPHQLEAQEIYHNQSFKNNLGETRDKLTRAMRLWNDNPYICAGRGIVCFLMKDYMAALRDFSRALELYPHMHQWLINRGNTYAKIYELDKAAADYDKAIELDPGNPDYYEIRRNFYFGNEYGTTERKIAYYNTIIRELKENPGIPITKTTENYTDLIAMMAFSEEYELLERFASEVDDFSLLLNDHVKKQFIDWQPTPLYFITSVNIYPQMIDPCRMLRFLGTLGADTDIPAGDGSTPLWNQCNYDGSIEILETLLQLGANPNKISIDDNVQWTPLLYCMAPVKDEDGNIETYDPATIGKVKHLLNYGADPNPGNKEIFLFTPLFFAVLFKIGKENLELIKLLIEKGADVNSTFEENGSSVLMEAIITYSDCDEDDEETCLEVIETLLINGADVNARNKERITPLLLSAEYDLFEVGQLLLLYGADTAYLPEKGEFYNPVNPDRQSFEYLITELRSKDGAMLVLPASDKDIELCNDMLPQLLPSDFEDFLKKYCNGFAYNGVDIYGTATVTDTETDFILRDIVSFTEDENTCYSDYLDCNLLWFGRVDEDLYTFNYDTMKYEVRSLECVTEIWDEYDTFEDFFVEEVGKFI